MEQLTEKRFTYMIDRVFDLWEVYDNKEKVICLVRNTDAKDLCDLLNELQEENEQLKKEIESWKKHCITHGIAVPITWGDKND